MSPESPDRVYSTRLRTALVFTGSGTAAAYHAGVLRALHEAGVKVDLAAGRGAGVVAALFAAVDGGARLWDADGLWRAAGSGRFYRYRQSLRVAAWALAAAGAILAIPLALLALAVILGIIGLLLTLVGLATAATSLTTFSTRWLDLLFSPLVLPTIIPRLALFAGLAAALSLAAAVIHGAFGARIRRRTRLGWAGRILGGPLSSRSIADRCATELWHLIRGAAPAPTLSRAELGRRYLELLSENLGQPGFRELLITLHDMDARRDLVLGLLAPRLRPAFFARGSVALPGRSTVAAAEARRKTELEDAESRQIEAFDLAGPSRDYMIDALEGSLALPLAVDPHLWTFTPEGPWRGETHRVCDRPGALSRLLEEVAAAGAEQVILVSGSPPPGRPHELGSSRGDLRGRAGEQLAAFESAALRDGLEHFAGRFGGLFVIRPGHNPLGPLDFGGVYDERSDRTHEMAELLDRGYEDAYHQFIEPVIGASGDSIASGGGGA